MRSIARLYGRTSFAIAAGTMLLSACARDVTAPSAEVQGGALSAVSAFQPTAATKALFGVVDGVYSVTFDPTRDQSFPLGPNRLDMPGRSVCRLVGSGYGSDYWNRSCTPETAPVTLTVTIKGAATDHPSVDFQPAMRFNPDKTVQLFMYVPNATQADATNWIMKYCGTLAPTCVDESASDAQLKSYVDRRANVVFRRIKHFSGYVVAEFSDNTESQPITGGF